MRSHAPTGGQNDTNVDLEYTSTEQILYHFGVEGLYSGKQARNGE